MADEEEFIPPNPTDLLPFYETDIRAVGIHRKVASGLEDEVDWKEVHGLSDEEAENLT